jgi:hypothetical protein
MLTKVGGGSVNLDNLREFFPTIANNATDSEHDLDIGAARIWVSDGTTEKLVDFAAATIAIDGAGLDTGTVANSTWYYLWVFYNPTTDDAIYRLSASSTSPTMPSGYTFKRAIHAVLTNSSANIVAAVWLDDRCTYVSGIVDHNQTSTFSITDTLQTLSVPPNSIATIALYLATATLTQLRVYPTFVSSLSTGYAYVRGTDVGAQVQIPVDSNSQIYRDLSTPHGVTNTFIATLEFQFQR